MKAFSIRGFPNYYITDTGDVYSRAYHPIQNRNNRIKRLSQNKKRNGYMSVVLCRGKERHTVSVHRLVAQAFIPNPNNYPVVNHKDGNKTNNCVSNLEWTTMKENNLHKYRVLKYTMPSGKNHWTYKRKHNAS